MPFSWDILGRLYGNPERSRTNKLRHLDKRRADPFQQYGYLALLYVITLLGLPTTCACRDPCPGMSDNLAFSIGRDVGISAEDAKWNNMLKTVLENASSYTRPDDGSGKPTRVVCDLFINSMDSPNVDNMDFSVNIYMRQSWVDPRLAFGDRLNVTRVTVDSKLFGHIWVPDLFFPNEKQSSYHCVTVPNRLIRVFPDGRVYYSARYSLRLACSMSLQLFPMDRQSCHLKMESYGYSDDELQFVWKEQAPLQVNGNIELSQFKLIRNYTGNCSTSYVTGTFTCLQATFELKRQFGYYIVQNYLPSFLIVVVSWVSFWINIDAVPARISLGVLTVLTMTTQSVGVWMSLPTVSYIKAIDIWMSVCVMLVFMAMLEFGIVNTMARKEIRKLSIKAKDSRKDTDQVDVIRRLMDEYTYGSSKHFDQSSRNMARMVDKISRRLFPVVFGIFNIVYWATFLSL